MTKPLSILFAGDVLTRPLARLQPGLPGFELAVSHHDIDQVPQLLAGPVEHDVVILHLTADFFLDEAAPGEPLGRMQAHCAALLEFAARGRALILINTLERRPERIVGEAHLDALAEHAALDSALIDVARRADNVSLVDVGGIVAALGAERALNLQNRLAMRMPYTKPALDAISAAYGQAIRERHSARKKVIVLDADNTLWGGIVGEDGVEGVAVDRQYPGLVFRRFQEQLRRLRETGILLALATKNNRSDVEELFARREMPLKLDDFAAVRIDWEPKSDNIVRIAEELNLGLESFVFIDDNPFELEQVRAALPMVETYRFEAGKADRALGLLASIDGLKTWSVTAEDRIKTTQYRQEKMRSDAKAGATSLEDYLDSLEIRLEIGRNRRAQVKRIAQLTNKTNQFNLTTRRHSEAEIERLMETGQVFDIRLVDRFGDMGVIGVVIVAEGEVETFLMSCRALGRGVEGRILAYVCSAVGDSGLRASYRPTAKNMMTATFYESNGFELVETGADGTKLYRMADGPRPKRDIPLLEVS
jgi:FkbH-like protein